MSGLNESQQYTTCESARQHFHQLTAGQWEGSWSRFPKRPILAYLRINLQYVKLIHKQVLHKCEESKDLITNRVNGSTTVPSACKTANRVCALSPKLFAWKFYLLRHLLPFCYQWRVHLNATKVRLPFVTSPIPQLRVIKDDVFCVAVATVLIRFFTSKTAPRHNSSRKDGDKFANFCLLLI